MKKPTLCCCFCDGEYVVGKEGSIQIFGEKLTYGVPEEVLMYQFCSRPCLKKCHEEENDELLETYLATN